MKTENKILMASARDALNGNWSTAVGATLVMCVVSGVASVIPFGSVLIGGALGTGTAFFFLSLSRKKSPVISDMFKWFYNFDIFLNSLVAILLVGLFTLLWSILLIIPGIIAAISYSQIFFIIAENPSITASDAIEKSKMMMYGNKWKYFCLGLRFIGWGLLSVLTLGIGFLWLIPYMQVSFAKFHDDIKSNPSTSNITNNGDVVNQPLSKEGSSQTVTESTTLQA